ncbi:hypothetical protein [Rhodanobacter lindaniclasticus]
MAQKLAIYALVAIALLVCGFGAGWARQGRERDGGAGEGRTGGFAGSGG